MVAVQPVQRAALAHGYALPTEVVILRHLASVHVLLVVAAHIHRSRATNHRPHPVAIGIVGVAGQSAQRLIPVSGAYFVNRGNLVVGVKVLAITGRSFWLLNH